MAVGTPLPESSSRPSDSNGFGAQVVKYDRYIETQLHRTRRQVKGVDIAGSLLLLAVASLAYLMLVALIDHWVVSGGLGFASRVIAFGLLAAGVLAFTVLRLVPLMLRRVNPVYAAYTIERHRPGIKNSLINFLLLRSGSERLPERIYEAMEVQAVNALSATNTDVAVDRAPVIRLLLAMVAILVGMAFYAVLSPKNPFTSFRRIISPWANVAPPTRVSIEDIEPGNGSGFHDQHIVVSAVIRGLRLGEEVTLRYSTRDGQVVDKPLRMALAENGYKHAVELPPDNLGLQQDLEYRIEAGDAISPPYKIRVDTAPTIVLEEIEYKYPAYSELPPRKVARHGDIQALDGTYVTLRAKANQPISQAHLDFECDGRNDLQMRVAGTRAEVSFALEWNEKTRKPEHESYQLRFRNDEGHENPKPIRYTIDVIPDLAPEVAFVEPELDPTKDLVVPPQKPVRFVLETADPDFKLASVTFHARRRGSPLVNDSLLAAPRAGALHRDYLLNLKPLDLKPGEQVEFWASADDNRQPKANHAETPHYQLRIAMRDEKNQPRDDDAANPDEKQGEKGGDSGKKQQRGDRNDDKQGGNQGQAGEQQKQGGGANQGKQNDQQEQQPGNQSGDEKSSGGKKQRGTSGKKSSSSKSSDNKSGEGGSDSTDGAQGSGQKRPGQPKQDPNQGPKQDAGQGEGEKNDESKRVDPERDAGKAIEEINKHFNQKEKANQPQEQPNDDNQSSGGKSGQQRKQQPSAEKDQDRESQDSDSGNQPQQNEGAGKSGKKSSAREGGSSGGQDQADSEKQPSGKQPAGKEAGQDSDGKARRQNGEGKDDKSTRRQTKTGKKGEQDPLAKKKDEKQQSQGERSADADQADDSQAEERQGEKQAGKSGKQPSAGEKGAEGAQPGSPNEGGDKTMKDESGGSKQGDAKVGDEGAKHADQETRPRDGQGGQARGAGETDDKMKKHKGESPDQKGGDQDSRDKSSGGAGNSEGGNKHGAPTTHGGNQAREKKQLSPDNKKGTSEDEPESSSEDKRQSDSQGAEQGEHDGGGKSGGGQRSNNEGTGTAGQNSEADQGGQQGQTQGEGPTGTKGGQQQKADKPTGGKSSGEKGPGTNQGEGQQSDRGIKADSPETADPRGHTNESRQPTQPQASDQQPPADKQAGTKKKRSPNDRASQSNQPREAEGEPTPSDRNGNDLRGGGQRTNPTSGGKPPADDQTTAPPPSPDESEPGGEAANQDYARKATDLALERLKDQLARDNPDPELLERLKWTREDIERFVQQWERLKKGADEAGPKGDAARQEFDDALRSLGLRPRGASLSSGTKRDDHQNNLRQDRRIAPPPEYQEQWYEYKKSVNKTGKR